MTLSPQQKERYARHLMLPEVGTEGQRLIAEARVLVVGLGGLGSPAALYLAAAGVGTLGLIDGDNVEISNLQRQVIHNTSALGKPKVTSAAETIARINPDVNTIVYEELLTEANAYDITGGYDFIVDATDSSQTKYLINDTCVKTGIAFSHGAIKEYGGYTFTYIPGYPCYRCLFGVNTPIKDIPPSASSGVLGVVPGILGSIQAAEALKYITGIGEPLTGRLLKFDIRTMNFNIIKFSHSPNCSACDTTK